MANGTAAKVASKPRGEGIFARLIKFIRESWTETFHKSAWPNKTELRQFTIVVIFAVVVVSVWIAGLDFLLGRIMDMISTGAGQ